MEKDTHQWTDDELIASLKDDRQSGDGIRALYRQYMAGLTHYVVHNNGSEEDAQDIFQEVVVSFVHLVKEGRFRGESSIKTFLYAINRNLWLNELKRRGRAGFREKLFEENRSTSDEQLSQVIESREATKQLMAVVESLGADCKKVLLLFYFENRSMREILDATNYESEQVVRNKKYKCLKKMEEKIRVQKTLFNQLKTFFHG